MSSHIESLEKTQDGILASLADLSKRLERAQIQVSSSSSSNASSALAQSEDIIAKLKARVEALESENHTLHKENKELKKGLFKEEYRSNHLIRELNASQAKR